MRARPPSAVAGLAAYAEQLLQLGDEEFLEASSTSPTEEGPKYAEDVRATCAWIVQQSAAGAGGQAQQLLFEWHAGAWQEHDPPTTSKGCRSLSVP